MIGPLDPIEIRRHVELVREEVDVEGIGIIYKMIVRTYDYINPTVVENLSWCSISSCSCDSDEGLEN